MGQSNARSHDRLDAEKVTDDLESRVYKSTLLKENHFG